MKKMISICLGVIIMSFVGTCAFMADSGDIDIVAYDVNSIYYKYSDDNYKIYNKRVNKPCTLGKYRINYMSLNNSKLKGYYTILNTENNMAYNYIIGESNIEPISILSGK